MVGRYLLAFRDYKFVAVVGEVGSRVSILVTSPVTISLACHCFNVNVVLFQIEYPGREILPQRQNGPAAEIEEFDLIRDLFSHLIVLINLLCFRERDLCIRILEFIILLNLAVSPDFKVALIDMTIMSKLWLIRISGQAASENVFEHAHHRRTVNILKLLEFRKGIYQINISICFILLIKL